MALRLSSISLLILLVSGLGILEPSAQEVEREVVVYTALDRMFSEPILKGFEEKTGIRVKPVFDTEATKTVGLANRIIAEKDNPVCDVFWNNEIARSLVLEQMGILEPYHSPSAEDIDPFFKSPQGYWTGHSLRGRVILINTDLVSPEDAPDSIFDLLDPRWKGKAGIANPLFGTTSTHSATLFAYLGDHMAKAFFQGLRDNDIKILTGNATAKDEVVAGIIHWCLTDTDDGNLPLLDGKPVKIIFPDQDGLGTLMIPHTLCLIRNSPNPNAGKVLIDYLLSPEVEAMLAESAYAPIPVRPGMGVPGREEWSLSKIRTLHVPWNRLPAGVEAAQPYLRDVFLR